MWGCRCFAFIPKERRDGKLTLKAELGACVGYATNKKAFRFYSAVTGTVCERRSIRFDELRRVDGSPFLDATLPPSMPPVVWHLDLDGCLQRIDLKGLDDLASRITLPAVTVPPRATGKRVRALRRTAQLARRRLI